MAVAARVIDEIPAGIVKLRPPSRLRLVDDVASSLEDAILSGRMRPGERLIETRICAELGVSRTTLREALLMLERRGLVRSEPRRGTFVTRLSRDETRDLCVARALLEAFALTSGFARLDERVFAALDDLLDRMAACRLPEEMSTLIQIDRRFHEHLVGVTDSVHVRELWASLNGQMSALILSSLEHYHATAVDVADFHRAMVRALRAGDVRLAGEAVIVHYVGTDEEDVALNSATLATIGGVIDALIARAKAT